MASVPCMAVLKGVSMKTASGAYTDTRSFISHVVHPLPKVSISERPRIRVASVDCSVPMHLNIHTRHRVRCLLLFLLLVGRAAGRLPDVVVARTQGRITSKPSPIRA